MNVPAQDQVESRAPIEPALHEPKQLSVAYLVNQYPRISHAFIRREIEALESLGVRVERFSLRPCAERLVDQADQRELEKTRIILQAGLPRMAASLISAALTRPTHFAHAFRLALRMGWNSGRGFFRHLAYFVEACILRRWLARIKVDHVHAHFATNPAAVAMLCHVLGGPPYSFTVHGPDDFDRARYLSLSDKIAGARFVITVSSYGRSQLYRWCEHRHWPKIHVRHPGVDDSILDHSPAPIPGAPRLVSIARLAEEKGHLLLLQALRALIRDRVPCELVLVGDGPMRTTLAAKIAEWRLEEHVVLTGALPSSEVRACLQNSRALILPSFAENLPSVILEAFALRRPVIATFIAGIPEVVEPGVNGWLVPAGSVECLEGAMREALAASVETLHRMGGEGAMRVRQFRSVDAARDLLGLFREAGKC